MVKNFSTFVRTAFVTAAVAQSGTASAFVLLSSAKAVLPVTPANPTVTFVWDGNVPELDEKEKYREGAFADLDDKQFMQQLLQDALNIWNNVPGSFLRMSVSEGTTSLDEEDKVFSIVVEKSDNLSTAAFAKPNVLPEDRNTIADCDISIADTKTTAKDLAYTITHELGHCIGLGHPHTNYGAIMGYSRMSRQLKLGADDIAGVVYLYPDPAYVGSEPKEIVCAAVNGAGGHQGGALLLLLLPLLAFVLRKPLPALARRRPAAGQAGK